MTSTTFFSIHSKQIMTGKLLIVAVYCGNCAAYSQKNVVAVSNGVALML